ncbi:MAG: hypothetical protein ACRDRI_04190 [Pseudonocardiaceae bacterium]
MTLIVLTVVVIALMVAFLAIFLFVIGALLNRTADNLDDCAQNVKKVAGQAKVVGPGIERINETGTTVVGAIPLLCDAAEQIGVAKSAPYVDPSETPPMASSRGYSSARSAVTSEVPRAAVDPEVHRAAVSTAPAPSPQSVGYLDGNRGSLGYLDA